MTRCDFDPRPELRDTRVSLMSCNSKVNDLREKRDLLAKQLEVIKADLRIAKREQSFFRSEVKRLQAALVQYLKRH